MLTRVEKFTIEVKDEGMIIKGGEGQHLFFTPVEALNKLNEIKKITGL